MKVIIVDTKRQVLYTKDVVSVAEYFNVSESNIRHDKVNDINIFYLKEDSKNPTGFAYFPFKAKIIYSNKIVIVKPNCKIGDEHTILTQSSFVESNEIKQKELKRLAIYGKK